jgi:tetratricopeptide (TPR) repeat protein
LEMGGLHDRVAMLLGMTLDVLGRPDQALAWNKLASQLTSNPGEADASLGDCWAKLVDDEQAERAYNRATELRPNSIDGTVGIVHLRLLEGNLEAAREICRTVSTIGNGFEDMVAQIEFFGRRFDLAEQLYRNLAAANPDGGGSFYGAVTYRSALARAKQGLGDTAGARALLEDCLSKERKIVEQEPESPEAFYRLAAIEAPLGMTEASFAHLRKAMVTGWVDYRYLSLDPRFDALRSPEFQTIINELSAKVADMRRQAVTKLEPIK